MEEYDLVDHEILNIIERAKKESEFWISNENPLEIQRSLKDNLTNSFLQYNMRYNNNLNPYHLKIGEIHMERSLIDHNYNKSIVGGGMYAIGSPILKKRFVAEGSAKGTSIASKYLSKKLPYNMSFKIYSINANFKLVSTKVLGRGIGRLIPNIGAALIVIDAIELLIELYEFDMKNNKVIFKGFGAGGSFGGHGNSGYW